MRAPIREVNSRGEPPCLCPLGQLGNPTYIHFYGCPHERPWRDLREHDIIEVRQDFERSIGVRR